VTSRWRYAPNLVTNIEKPMSPDDDELTAVESANEALTRAFNQCWSDRDCDRLLTLLADAAQYQVYDDGPVHVGHAAIEGAVRPFMAKYSRIEFNILRLQVMGPAVTHERTEDYHGPAGELDTHFHVVGLLVIRDGKITIWRDYALPGAQQVVGPLCTQK
jgi:limonene-1,2-epoxide hydrolase